jgi:hypothetical protein
MVVRERLFHAEAKNWRWLMHAVHPHATRSLVLGLAAALVTMGILLTTASRLGDITTGSSAGVPSAAPRGARSQQSVPSARPLWASSPFASPFKVTVPWPPAVR